MATRLTSIPGKKQTSTTDSVDDRIARLEIRLQDGFARIGEAMNHGIDVENWEDHWIRLLREYEMLQDDLADAA